jgi:hypothetical protein
MASNLERRLTMLERQAVAGTGDHLDELRAWVAGARSRLATDVSDDDVWAFVEGLTDLQRANLRMASSSENATFARDLVAGGFLGDDAQRALAGDDLPEVLAGDGSG